MDYARIPQEDPVTLKRAAELNPALSYWKLHRWATAGLAGVKLETWFIGARRYTSMEAIARFNAKQTAIRNGGNIVTPMMARRMANRDRKRLRVEFGI